MKIFGLTKKHIDILKTIFEKHLAEQADIKVYLFGSRATGKFKEFSDIDVAIKSKDTNLKDKLFRIQDDLEESELPFKVDLLNWDEIAKEYLSNIKKQKVLFWTPKEIEKKSPWRICPLGEHWTKKHPYTTKNGKISVQTGHCKKNPSGKDILKKDELSLIPSLEIFKHQKNQMVKNDLGFKNGNDYDELIAGWVAYWNDIIKTPVPLNPNYLKVLIATESGFRENIIIPNKNKKIGHALGLTQLTESTIKILKDKKGEIKNHYVELAKNNALDPNMNIAGCSRWLFRKYETAKKRLKREPSWEEVLWEYKGITLDKSPKASRIKQDLKKYLLLVNPQS